MRTYLGSGGISPRILKLGNKWRWVVSFTPQSFYSRGKKPSYTLDRRLAGPQIWCERVGEERYWPCWESNPRLPARSLVSVLTELPRLQFCKSRGRQSLNKTVYTYGGRLLCETIWSNGTWIWKTILNGS
jgi:hypothetical protein